MQSTSLVVGNRLACIVDKPTTRRFISNYLKDAWAQKSWRVTNPLLDLLGIVKNNGPTAQPPSLPPPRLVQPHHVPPVIDHILSSLDDDKQNSKNNNREVAGGQVTDTPDATAALRRLDALLAPRWILLQYMALRLHMVSSSEGAKEKMEWEEQAHIVNIRLPAWATTSPGVYEPLIGVAPRTVLHRYETATGHVVRGDLPVVDAESYRDILEALEEVEMELQQQPRPNLSSIYNYIGLKTMQSEKLGYRSVADRVLAQTGSVSIDDVRQLHTELTDAVLPLVRGFAAVAQQPKSVVDQYTSHAGREYLKDLRVNEAVYYAKLDRVVMLKLEDHVTLDGALQFLFRVAKDLVGVDVELVEKRKHSSYDPTIHHYRAYDSHQKLLGTFYLDPFRALQQEENVRPLTLPIVPRGPDRLPVVYVRLGAATRMWDSDPENLTWGEVEGLFHEFGHLLQFLLAASEYGAVLGPQNMPMDLSEVLPKFMELWLTEKSTIHALIHLSKSTKPFDDTALEAAFRVQTRTKALQLVQNVFLGALELELFSGFDLKGPESVMDLQQRLGAAMVPHDMPSKRDLSPIRDLLLENVSGAELCRYRYVLGDVLAASLYESCRHRYANDPAQLRRDFCGALVEPGASIDLKDIQEAFGIDKLSTKPFLERYSF